MHDFVALTIAETYRETKDALSVRFAIPDAIQPIFRFRPGQHLTIAAALEGAEIRRTYSICSGSDDPTLTITIKRVPDGLFSNWAFDTLKAGMTLNVMPPAGRFLLPRMQGDRAHFLAIAVGAGITPIMAMADHAMRRHTQTRFTLIYGNSDLDSIIFRERLEDLKDAHLDRFTLVHVLSRNQESDSPLLEGRITPDTMQAFAGHLFDVSDIDDAFLCGPGTMIRDLRNALIDAGLSGERIHHEFFAPAGATTLPPPDVINQHSNARPQGQAPAISAADTSASEIVAVIDGVRHRFSTRPEEVVIDAALRAGVRVPYACKGGMCSTCRARVIDGRATMRVNYSLEPWELEKGFILTCQAIPETARLVLDFDAM
ncbi:MAG: 2Fe-2S iron-sulfur cluster-binding protein [Hyphomicrobiaceae bacterium]